MSESLPKLIVITGRPGAGKSTLSRELADAIRVPAISRDSIKEGLVFTTRQSGQGGDAIAKQVYQAFFNSIEMLLRRQISLIAEAAFQHKLWQPRLMALKPFADLRLVICDIPADLAERRRTTRSLADPRFAEFHPGTPGPTYDPPLLDVPTLRVDSSAGYQPSLKEIAAFVSQ